MLDGNMICGVVDDAFIARVGPDANALDEPHAREMDFTDREMHGFVFVDPPGMAADHDLDAWVDHCLAHAESLPGKNGQQEPPSSYDH
jgi:hypothetical protein